MAVEREMSSIPEPPRENFARGLLTVDIPELGVPKESGKVRDNYVVEKDGQKLRVMVTTDRQSAFDKDICLIPGKGQVLNELSAFWFEKTREIVPNHMLAVPHPNVLIAKQAEAKLPVELIFRRYMARSSTTTSVYTNYFGDESRGINARREIYGIRFPEGLKANQEFPMGTISTPTTKAGSGQHDLELTDEQAEQLVENQFGRGIWRQAKEAGLALFEYALDYHKQRGLILADTKLELGLDKNGKLILIDEVFTPDSSRFWLEDTYEQRLNEGKNPDSFDKEILRRWLAERGFTGEGPVPIVDPNIIDQMASAYRVPYEMITGKSLSQDPEEANPDSIRKAVLGYFSSR